MNLNEIERQVNYDKNAEKIVLYKKDVLKMIERIKELESKLDGCNCKTR